MIASLVSLAVTVAALLLMLSLPLGDSHAGGAQFVRNLPQLLFVEATKIRGNFDGVEKRSGYGHDPNNIVAPRRAG